MPKPGYIDFLNNEELLTQEAKKIYNILKQANPTDFNYTEEDFINSAKNSKKRELYKKANECNDLTVKRVDLMHKYEKSGLFNKEIQPSMARHAFSFINTEDTLETDIENIKTLNSLTTRKGATEEVNSELDEVTHFDYTKLDFKTDEEMIDFYKNNYQFVQKAFVMKSTVGNGKLYADADITKFLAQKDGMIETIKSKCEPVAAYSSILYLVLPEDIKLNHLVNAAAPLKEEYEKGADAITNYVNTKEFRLYESFDVGYKKLIEEGIISKDFMFEYKTYDVYDKNKVNDKDYTPEEIKPNQAIQKYGEAYLDYQKLDQKENKISFEDYLKSRSMDKMFIKRSPEEIKEDRVKNLIESKNCILSDVDAKKYVDDKINEFKNLKGSAFGRSTRRINAVNDYMNELFKPDSSITVNGIKPSDALKKMLAVRASKLIEDIHKERSSSWKFWHPRQNAKEEKFVNSINDNLKKKAGMYQQNITNSIKAYSDLGGRIAEEKMKLEEAIELPKTKEDKNIIKSNEELEVSNPQKTAQEKFKDLAKDTSDQQTKDVSKKVTENKAPQVNLNMDK